MVPDVVRVVQQGILFVCGLDCRRSVGRHKRRCARIGRPLAAVRQRDCVCLHFMRAKKKSIGRSTTVSKLRRIISEASLSVIENVMLVHKQNYKTQSLSCRTRHFVPCQVRFYHFLLFKINQGINASLQIDLGRKKHVHVDVKDITKFTKDHSSTWKWSFHIYLEIITL